MKIMKRIGSALVAAAVAAVSMSSFAVFAQEDNTVVKRDPSKNYEYYRSLSDKEVYNEMCKAYGLEPSETFEPNCGLSYGCTPEGKQVPELFWAISTFTWAYHEFHIYNVAASVNDSLIEAKASNISYFGFDKEYAGCFDFLSDNLWGSYAKGIVIDVDFGKDSKLHAKNIADFYRVFLTFANSQFAVDCCYNNDVSKDIEKITCDVDGSRLSIDANNDGSEDIDDALHILRAVVGIKQPSDLEDCVRCDIDRDGIISSNDALRILEWKVGLLHFC